MAKSVIFKVHSSSVTFGKDKVRAKSVIFQVNTSSVTLEKDKVRFEVIDLT